MQESVGVAENVIIRSREFKVSLLETDIMQILVHQLSSLLLLLANDHCQMLQYN